jgi:hypothetical protein
MAARTCSDWVGAVVVPLTMAAAMLPAMLSVWASERRAGRREKGR